MCSVPFNANFWIQIVLKEAEIERDSQIWRLEMGPNPSENKYWPKIAGSYLKVQRNRFLLEIKEIDSY